MKITFKQGIHPPYKKELSRMQPFKKANKPEKVIIPLQQHIGAPCEPLVEKGDLVKCGQKIADSDSFISAPIHASISGEIVDIKDHVLPSGEKKPAIFIKAGEENSFESDLKIYQESDDLSAEKIKEIVKEAGITGMGGAMFPTHVKLSVPEDKKLDYFILNGAECEPYLTVDEQMMIQYPEEIISGMKLMMKAVNVENGIIAIEDNKPDAEAALDKILKENNESSIKIRVLETKYPQGGEKMLIKAILNREVPFRGLPLDVGVVVNNVLTARAVYQAVYHGKPLIERPLTITGAGVKNPCNIIAPIGTPVQDLIDLAGGFKKKPAKVIFGGPMMGNSQQDLLSPIIKGTSGVLVLTDDQVREEKTLPCINCARCVDSCPMYLMPTQLMKFIKEDMYDLAEDYMLENCIECGCCSYVCPSKISLVHYFKIGKAELQARKRDQIESE